MLTALVTPSSIAGSTTWSDVTGSPVTNDPTDSEVFNRALVGISAIVVDHTDTTGKTVYVGIAGFGGQGFAPLARRMCPCSTAARMAGATWQNLTNDLPNAPVNAVLVDPEDPAIVYVGTDVGVYVTTSITQCIDVNAELLECLRRRTAGGTGDDAERSGYGRGEVAAGGNERPWRLAGGVGKHGAEDSGGDGDDQPATLPFASQAVGTTSAAESLTIRNTGTSR